MILSIVGEGVIAYRYGPMQQWVRIKWEELVKGDIILRIQYNKGNGDIERIQKCFVTEPPDASKDGCPVMCDVEEV